MSLARLVYYTAVLAGWGAFTAWLIAEGFILGRISNESFEVLVTAAIVGGAIGCAVNAASALTGGGTDALLKKSSLGFVGGALGGAVGGTLGNILFGFGLPRSLGWMLMGIGIGIVEGLQESSLNKIRNGLIGGTIGGLLGGILFDLIQKVISSGSGMSSRATAFVVLGLAIGACIGLAQVVLKEAWLTVVDGYRPGRQLILSRPVTVLGRGEYLPLPLMGPMNSSLEIEHATISRQPGGAFVLETKGPGVPVFLGPHQINGPTKLIDGNIIKLGANHLRYNERQTQHLDDTVPVTGGSVIQTAPPPAPPPVLRPSPPSGRASQRGSSSPPAPSKKPPTSTIRPPSTGRPPPPPPPPPPQNK